MIVVFPPQAAHRPMIGDVPDLPHLQPPSREALERALAELSEPGALAGTQELVLALAPRLQKLLDVALTTGGWFDDAHEGAVLKAATTPDDDERIQAVRALVAEQTRLGMLVGVAVGMELATRTRAGDAD